MNGVNDNQVSIHRLRNLMPTAVLLGAMAGLLALLGWLFGGVAGVI